MSFSIQGILVTILVLGILIAIHESGHFLAAKSIKVPVRQFAIGFGPRIFGFMWGETECRLNWIPLGGYCAFVDDERTDEGEMVNVPDESLLRNRAIWQRLWVVSAGVLFNFVSAWIILFVGCLSVGVPTGQQTVAVRQVMPDSRAMKAGLQAGDRFVDIGKQPFQDFASFQSRLGSFKNKSVVVTIVRNSQTMDLSVTPGPDGKLGFLANTHDVLRPLTSPAEAVTVATARQVQVTQMLCSALYQLFTSPGTMMDKTGGPVQIVAMGDQIYQHNPLQLLDFAVILSIELAIINLLPLPALDGGHIVMLLMEKLRGRPLPRQLEERILVAGFAMIMGLGMLLIVKDLMTVPGMYHTPSKPAVSAPAKP